MFARCGFSLQSYGRVPVGSCHLFELGDFAVGVEPERFLSRYVLSRDCQILSSPRMICLVVVSSVFHQSIRDPGDSDFWF